MTLKKLLKKVSDVDLIEICYPDICGSKLHFGYREEVDPNYMDMVVTDVFASGNRLCINVKEPNPKRSTNNKAYKKWMKKYVKDHMDEIGLKDGGYAGDSADNDKHCECAIKNPITGTFHCVKWMFIECDCEYMRIESPVCAYCGKQIEG